MRFQRGQVSEFNAFLSLSDMKDEPKSTLLEQIMDTDIVTMYVILLKPKSRGKVELSSPSATDKPNIFPNYLGDKADMSAMLHSVKQRLAITKTKAFEEYDAKFVRLSIPECDCDAEFKSDEYYRCYIRQFSFSFYHPVGTSKMGPDTDAGAVVDYQLRVKGIRHLRQIDAGVIPIVPSANTNPATIMVAERGAQFVKDDWLGRSDYYSV